MRDRSGQPLIAIAALALGWTALRLFVWDGTGSIDSGSAIGPFAQETVNRHSRGLPPRGRAMASALAASDFYRPVQNNHSPKDAHWISALGKSVTVARPRPTLTGMEFGIATPLAKMQKDRLSSRALPPSVFVGTSPSGPAARQPIPLALANPARTNPPSRWSADAWLLLREGSQRSVAAAAPSYGGSQMGAILRYRLAPNLPQRPTAYARATRSLAGEPVDAELAAGLSARPIADLPVVIAAEARFRQSPGDAEVRPAILGWTELPAASLPLRARAEAYLQAGYVGGRNATGFVDGQLRVDRKVASALGGTAEIRGGAAAWGGAQKGASRLDIGPTASMRLDLGKATARVAIDWRFRVAGDAAPQSGPVATFTVGF